MPVVLDTEPPPSPLLPQSGEQKRPEGGEQNGGGEPAVTPV